VKKSQDTVRTLTVSSFCFEAKNWYRVFPFSNFIEVDVCVRQKDDLKFVEALNEIRCSSELSPATLKIIEKCRSREREEDEENVLHIYCLKMDVDSCNDRYLNELLKRTNPTEIHVCEHVDDTRPWTSKYLQLYEYRKELYMKTYARWKVVSAMKTKQNEANEMFREMSSFLRKYSHMDREERTASEQLNESIRAYSSITLVQGARVMLSANLDVRNVLSSGKLGTIISIDSIEESHCPTVQWDDGNPKTSIIKPYTWQAPYKDGYRTVCQFPLLYAWGLTVHKVQSLSLDRAIVDVSRAFSPGHVYTALSRVRKQSGLRLTGFDVSKCRVDTRVVQFMNAARQYHMEKPETSDQKDDMAALPPPTTIKPFLSIRKQHQYLESRATRHFTHDERVDLMEEKQPMKSKSRPKRDDETMTSHRPKQDNETMTSHRPKQDNETMTSHRPKQDNETTHRPKQDNETTHRPKRDKAPLRDIPSGAVEKNDSSDEFLAPIQEFRSPLRTVVPPTPQIDTWWESYR
jgi:hypothetical protein